MLKLFFNWLFAYQNVTLSRLLTINEKPNKMKPNFIKTLLLVSFSILLFSCSKQEDINSPEAYSPETTLEPGTNANTEVSLTAITINGEAKAGYKIIMFDTQPVAGSSLPPTILEATTDANGLAFFDLKTIITATTAQTFYFEVFELVGADYVWKSQSHYSVDLSKGTIAKSAIIVD